MYQIKVPHHMQDGLRNGDYQLKPMILTNCKCRHCTKAKTNNRCYYAQAREHGRGSSRYLKEEGCTCQCSVESSCLKRNTQSNYLYKCFPGAGRSGRSNNHYYMSSDSYDREDSWESSLPPLIDEGAYWSKRLASLTDFSRKTSPSPHTLSFQQEASVQVLAAEKVDKGIEANIFQDDSFQDIGRHNATNNTVQVPEVYRRLPHIRPKSANLEMFKEKNLLIDRIIEKEQRESTKTKPSTTANNFTPGQPRRVAEEKGTGTTSQITKISKSTMVEKKPKTHELTTTDDNQKQAERVENVDGFPLQDFYRLLDNVPSTFFASTHLMNHPLRQSLKRPSRLCITPSKNKDWKAKLWGKIKQLNRSKVNNRVKNKSRSKSRKVKSSRKKKKKVHRHRHKKTYSKFTSTTTINNEKSKETRPPPAVVPLPMLLPNIT